MTHKVSRSRYFGFCQIMTPDRAGNVRTPPPNRPLSDSLAVYCILYQFGVISSLFQFRFTTAERVPQVFSFPGHSKMCLLMATAFIFCANPLNMAMALTSEAAVPAPVDRVDSPGPAHPALAAAHEISLEVPEFGPIRFVLVEAGPFMMGSSNQRAESAAEDEGDDEAGPPAETGEVSLKIEEALPEGSDDPDSEEDEIWRRVTITHDYYIGMTEVTQGLYTLVAGENPSCFRWSGNDFPVDQVSWADAVRFCNALSRRMGMEECYNEKTGDCDFKKRGFRLPTEAEWEKAARAGSLTVFDFGDDNALIKDYAVVSSTGAKSTARVGTLKPSAAGLFDIYGNVWEWCQDLYLFENHTLPPTDPCWQGAKAKAGTDSGDGSVSSNGPAAPSGSEDSDMEEEEEARMRVIRGGGWGSVYYDCRTANRGRGVPTGNFNDVGFRIVFQK